MAKVRIILKTNRKLSNNCYPVVISLAHLKNPTKYIRVEGFYAAKNEWSYSLSRFKPSKGKNYKKLNSILEEIEVKIEGVNEQLSAMGRFTYDAFHKLYFADENLDKCVKSAYQRRINDMKSTDRIGTAMFYESSWKAIHGFINKSQLTFDHITYAWLKDFELYKRRRGVTGNTIAVYLRGLRAIHYEYCKVNNLNKPSAYIQFNIQGLLTPTMKRSLSKDQVKRFIEHNPISEAQLDAKQLFLFSFYTRGTNLMDMLQFTKDNIDGEYLVYRRQKTGKHMRMKLTAEAIDVLSFFKNDSKYLFPYMRKGDVPKHRVTDVNRNINRRLKLFGDAIGIEHISMYYARHTFAELQYKSGVRIEIISQMLGHSDLKTTQTYLRSFSDDEVDNAASKVFDSLR